MPPVPIYASPARFSSLTVCAVTPASFFIASAILRRLARLAAILARISDPLLEPRNDVVGSRTAELATMDGEITANSRTEILCNMRSAGMRQHPRWSATFETHVSSDTLGHGHLQVASYRLITQYRGSEVPSQSTAWRVPMSSRHCQDLQTEPRTKTPKEGTRKFRVNMPLSVHLFRSYR